MIQTGLERRAGAVGVTVGAAAVIVVTGAVTPVATVTSAIMQTLCNIRQIVKLFDTNISIPFNFFKADGNHRNFCLFSSRICETPK